MHTHVDRAMGVVVLTALAVLAGASNVAGQCDPTLEKVVVPDAFSDANVGKSVDVSGDVAIIGAPLETGAAFLSGAAYVFRYNGSDWVQEQKLFAHDSESADYFGGAVAIHESLAVVGAPWHGESGAAYVYRYNGTSWVEEQKLTAPDGAQKTRFGQSVATIWLNKILVGAPNDSESAPLAGAAYMYEFSGGEVDWYLSQKLVASDPSPFALFGQSVALGTHYALVGAVMPSGNGAAYIFQTDSFGWSERAKLVASDGATGDFYGGSVAIHSNVALIGAPGDDDSGEESGSAYLYTYDGKTWVEQPKLVALDGAAGAGFGIAVALPRTGDSAIIGAYHDSETTKLAGAAYVFRNDGDAWMQQAKLTAEIPSPNDQLGGAVAIDGETIMVGCDQCDGSAGAVFIGELCENASCTGDLNSDSVVDVSDLLQLLSAWGSCPGCNADFNTDGVVDVSDLLQLLSAWGSCDV